MANSFEGNPRSREIDAAIVEYLEALERGAPLDREAFLAKHPKIITELREFLEDESALKRAGPWRN